MNKARHAKMIDNDKEVGGQIINKKINCEKNSIILMMIMDLH